MSILIFLTVIDRNLELQALMHFKKTWSEKLYIEASKELLFDLLTLHQR